MTFDLSALGPDGRSLPDGPEFHCANRWMAFVVTRLDEIGAVTRDAHLPLVPVDALLSNGQDVGPLLVQGTLRVIDDHLADLHARLWNETLEQEFTVDEWTRFIAVLRAATEYGLAVD